MILITRALAIPNFHGVVGGGSWLHIRLFYLIHISATRYEVSRPNSTNKMEKLIPPLTLNLKPKFSNP